LQGFKQLDLGFQLLVCFGNVLGQVLGREDEPAQLGDKDCLQVIGVDFATAGLAGVLRRVGKRVHLATVLAENHA
jgi:hypothetical protein